MLYYLEFSEREESRLATLFLQEKPWLLARRCWAWGVPFRPCFPEDWRGAQVRSSEFGWWGFSSMGQLVKVSKPGNPPLGHPQIIAKVTKCCKIPKAITFF